MTIITKSFLDSLKPSTKRLAYYDDKLAGFGVRVTPAGAKSFVIRYRAGGGGRGSAERLYTIGRYGSLTAEEARKRAKAALGLVANGGDPAGDRAEQRASLTVRELIDRYMELVVHPKRKASTAALYSIYFDKHVLPELGTRRARDLKRADVSRLHRKIGEEAPATANRVIVTLSGALRWGQEEGEIPAGANPCAGIERFAEAGRERYLSSEEMARLGGALQLAETEGLPWIVDEENPKVKHAPKPENRKRLVDTGAVAAIRLLLFTGCRLREILHLRWEEVDAERGLLFLPDSKTGKKSVILNAPSLEVLSKLPRLGNYVIPGLTAGQEDEKPRADLHRPWRAITSHASLTDLRIHDLRHTHASVGAGAGLGLPIIGRLLGHKQTETTAKYAHLATDPLRKASDQIAGIISTAMKNASCADIVLLQKRKSA